MFYEFRQNNSGGSFDVPALNVIIEAENLDQAVARAEKKGLYFHGCASGIDCHCCGDRWRTPFSDDGTQEPCHYNTPVKEFVFDSDLFWAKRYKIPMWIIYYADGRIESSNDDSKE